jgi:hypothetical protein
MILGFAHLAFSTADADTAVAAFGRRGLTIGAAYRKVPSNPAKAPLLGRPAASHDLILLSGSIAVEVVSHDTGTAPGRAKLDLESDDRTIALRVRRVAREREFLTESLGCVAGEDGATLAVRGPFPGWRATLRLVEDAEAPEMPVLDIDWFSCLGFYSTNLQEDMARLLETGARHATKAFNVKLGDREMEILMLRSPDGIVIELIKVIRT